MKSDASRLGAEAETPVNPQSLLVAVNEASDTVSTGWLIFLGIMAYAVIAVAGVTHKDLLLETPVSLPILQVDIDLKHFFQFTPVLLVLFHLGVVAQLVLLARKTLEFDKAVQLLEPTSTRSHPLRLELHSFFFVQAIAGPERSLIMSAFLHGMSWLTTVVMPVILLLFIQASYLPAHDVTTTWIQRVALVTDLSVLLLIGTFLLRTESSFFKAFVRNAAAHPLNVSLTSSLMFFVLFLSFFAATVPGELLDRMARTIVPAETSRDGNRRAEGGFILPFLGSTEDGSLFGLFSRNLVVRDTDLVADKDVTPGEPTLNLRGRDLRYAALDRSDLHQADFTGADLSDATLTGADLRGIRFNCADLNRLILTDDRNSADCASAERADFSNANLQRANLAGADFTAARFSDTNLNAAQLSYAILTGAAFSAAKLDGASMTGGVKAEGTNFLLATLQGADLGGIHAQGADFSNASLQAANFAFARLEGATLAGANLDAATLFKAKLQAADLAQSSVNGADFRGTLIWLTSAPQNDTTATSSYSGIDISPPGEPEAADLSKAIDKIGNSTAAEHVRRQLARLIDGTENGTWPSSAAMAQWTALSSRDADGSAADQPPRLTAYLGDLMCKSRWHDANIASGVIRRARTPQFQGDRSLILARIQSPDCPAAAELPAEILRDFKVEIEALSDASPR